MELTKLISIVGVGPGNPDYLTRIAIQRVNAAAVLVGAQRLLDMFPRFQGVTVSLSNGIAQALDAMDNALPKRIAVLVSGDPGLMSLSANVLKRFGRQQCEVIAGVSSVQLAFSRLGIDWQDVTLVNAHGQNPSLNPESLARKPKIAVLCGCSTSSTWLTKIGQALNASHQIIAFENLTLVDERQFHVRPAELASLAASRLTIIVFLRKTPNRAGKRIP